MATYVLSDVHGRLKPLDRALEALSPGAADKIFVLGDMVDRGPDPVGVMQLLRGLDNACILWGNHEELMVDCILHPDDPEASFNWGRNGGQTTLDGLKKLKSSAATDLIDWVRSLELYTHCSVGGRRYLMVHAGLRGGVGPVPSAWGDYASSLFLSRQDPEDLLWIREGYLDQPTGLMGTDGKGPVVIAGHTPTILSALYMDKREAPRACDLARKTGEHARDSDETEESTMGLPCVVYMGACQDTGGWHDKIDIDCGCAAGPGLGRLGVLCLDTGRVHYEEILDGE